MNKGTNLFKFDYTVEIGKDISTFNFGKFCKITDLSNDCEVVFIDKNNHQP